MNCHICNKQISNKNHIYICDVKNLSKKQIRFNFLQHNFNEICNENLIKEEYVKNNLSLPDFKKKYGLSYKQTEFLLDYFNIKKRTASESSKLITNKKMEQYFLLNYGVKNASQLAEIKEKKKKSFITKYGVDNIRKSKEYYIQLHKNMLEKYGKKSVPNLHGNANPFNMKNLSKDEQANRIKQANIGFKKYWNNLSDDEKNRLIQKRAETKLKNNPIKFDSKLEERISRLLLLLNVSHIRQFFIKRLSYDFFIYKTKIILEIQGDFWHGNPNKYKSDDILNFPNEKVLAHELWDKDNKKRIIAEKNGYIVHYLWESDMNEKNDEQLIETLINIIQNGTN